MYQKVYPNRINWKNTPSTNTPLNQTNLNKMDKALYQIDQAVYDLDGNKANLADLNTAITDFQNQLTSGLSSKASTSMVNQAVSAINGQIQTLTTSKANQSDMLLSIKSVAYNTSTGKWTFTHFDGTKNIFDQNIEKIPVSFSMSPQGVITMVTADGTTYTANVADLIKTYTFTDTNTIDFTTTTDSSGNKTITAVVKNGSITADKLQPNYLADVTTQAQNANASALLSQSYAIGGTGTRSGENTDNSMYYSQQSHTNATNAQTSASDAASSASAAQTAYNDSVTIHDDVLQIKSETEQLLNNIEQEVNTIIENAFSESVPSVYVDLTDGTLYYQSGTFRFQVDENISSPTLGELLWEVV